MSDDRDVWDMLKEEREKKRKRNQARLPERQAEIESLRELGYTVKKNTEYQYRINDTYDLYPIHNRWHNLKTGERGGAKNLKQFIIKNLSGNE